MNLDYFDPMAARSDAAPAKWRQSLLWLFDGIDRGWAIPALIVAFATMWFLFLTIAYLSGDLHVDALETWTLGREFSWGNAKHPPLMGWVAWLWTLVFPLTDWSFQLLAMTNAAVALWAVDLLARRFVHGDKRAIVLLLLMLLPAYQFHAQRFNANTVLLAIWPLATYCFLRAFQSRRIGWAIATGAMAALAMLGKYYSIFLVISFVLAAIAHPERRAYFTSWSPWVSSLTGFVLLAPHLVWLAGTGFEAFDYAMMVHGGNSLAFSTWEAIKFFAGIAAALALPTLGWVLIANRRLAQLPADLKILDPGLWLLFLILIGTLVLPALTAITIGSDMPSLWALQGLFLISVLVVGGAQFPIARFHTVNLAVCVFAIGVLAVVFAAPIHAYYRNVNHSDRAFYKIAALEITRQWREATGAPLTAISGDDPLAFATAFYSPDHPHYTRPVRLYYSRPIPPLPLLARGWAAMCFAEDVGCVMWMNDVAKIAPRPIRSDFVARPSLWGTPGATTRIETLMVLPQPRKAGGASAPLQPALAPDEVSARQR